MEVTQLREIFRAIREFVRKADMILLALCVTATVFGIVVISSATNYGGSARYVRTQTLALILGIAVYVVLTLIDVDIIAERRELLLLFCTVFIALLFKWGDTQQGNRSWLNFSFLPFSIQPAELCKIPFILILAKIMSVKQNKLSAEPCNIPAKLSAETACRSGYGYPFPGKRSGISFNPMFGRHNITHDNNTIKQAGSQYPLI